MWFVAVDLIRLCSPKTASPTCRDKGGMWVLLLSHGNYNWNVALLLQASPSPGTRRAEFALSCTDFYSIYNSSKGTAPASLCNTHWKAVYISELLWKTAQNQSEISPLAARCFVQSFSWQPPFLPRGISGTTAMLSKSEMAFCALTSSCSTAFLPALCESPSGLFCQWRGLQGN